MLEKLIFTKNMDLLQKAMGASTLRNHAIANNLANIDTPGYKRSQVDFEEELKKALQNKGGLKGAKTHPKHFSIGIRDISEIKGRLVVDGSTAFRNDGNNVDIDKEMADLTKNQIMYNYLVEQIQGEFSKMKTAITDGRG